MKTKIEGMSHACRLGTGGGKKKKLVKIFETTSKVAGENVLWAPTVWPNLSERAQRE